MTGHLLPGVRAKSQNALPQNGVFFFRPHRRRKKRSSRRPARRTIIVERRRFLRRGRSRGTRRGPRTRQGTQGRRAQALQPLLLFGYFRRLHSTLILASSSLHHETTPLAPRITPAQALHVHGGPRRPQRHVALHESGIKDPSLDTILDAIGVASGVFQSAQQILQQLSQSQRHS